MIWEITTAEEQRAREIIRQTLRRKSWPELRKFIELRQVLGVSPTNQDLSHDLVGVLVWSIENKHTGAWLFIKGIAVDPSYQRDGIGTRLIEALWKLSPNTSGIRLHVYASNEKGVKFYLKNGFDARLSFLYHGEQVWVMERRR
jgi:ribosomal protein S18 acetylase RimI-like enzyme